MKYNDHEFDPVTDEERAAAKGLFDGSVPQYRINFETRMMGALMPRESEVCRKFRKLYAKGGPKACLLYTSDAADE